MFSTVAQEMAKEQSVASVGMYLLADKYDIPCLAGFARRSLMESLSLSNAASWKGQLSAALDPWQVATHASRCNDQALVDFCMDLVVAPLRRGRNMLAPTTATPILPALFQVMMDKVNVISASH